jgi:hypothetical protein
MGRKFGIKEANAASIFAKSKEQKETVVAMLGMLGIPILIKEQIGKAIGKLTKRILKNADKVSTLHDKADVLESHMDDDEAEAEAYKLTAQDWDFYNYR